MVGVGIFKRTSRYREANSWDNNGKLWATFYVLWFLGGEGYSIRVRSLSHFPRESLLGDIRRGWFVDSIPCIPSSVTV